MRHPLGALLGALLFVAGCATGTPPTTGGPSPPRTGPPSDLAPVTGPAPAAGSPTTVLPGTDGQFSSTDIAWLQLTVAMAERLLPILDLVPSRTTDPAWRRLATRIETGERMHLSRSRRLLVDSGAPVANPHEGHDMPGMVTDEELTALRSATGQQFHHRFARHLRAHLTQSLRIATAEQRVGSHPATTGLAAAVIRAGTVDLAQLSRIEPAAATQPERRERASTTPPTTTAISPTTSAT
ncbi:DUF305 domain-containing protein [Micromonospora sp. C95]|uniref:DUF305 domain-containing protein n=1 Tax=Micromonospora sp. C95 TaxID=2824882 RepID=UPI001B35E1C4|nr:DUF305 domain-containing protein [Micromonospora sp. C95]MBQ1023394.1 DUF305 domain-containing protein [Micromonospora sp. C95]